MDLNTGLTQALFDGTNTYVYGLGRIAQTNATSTDYFLGDALGSVRQLTNQTGAITYARAYDPYGVVTQTSGASQTTYGYTGEFTSNNMVYLRSCMYSPITGRFLTRDMWDGDENIPMSYNQWLYTYAQPISNVDPTGLQTDHQLFADFKDDYDDRHKDAIRWTSQEKNIVLQALGAIAVAYAKAYNHEAAKRGLIDDCSTIELYIDPTTRRIDPFSAFNRIHNTGQKLVIYKHTNSLPNGAGVWGTGYSRHTLDIWAAGHFNENNISYLSRYGQASFNTAMDNYRRFITHEMGHVFEHTVIDNKPGVTPHSLLRGPLGQGNRSDLNGFCGSNIESSGDKERQWEGWQWRLSNDSVEYFADMFTGWTYNCWETDADKQLTELGQLRSNFMNQHMQEWVYSLAYRGSGSRRGR